MAKDFLYFYLLISIQNIAISGASQHFATV